MIQPAKLLRTALVTAVLSTVCVVSASAASVGVGTVNTDALRLRDEASTSATVLGTASKGDTVVVLEDAGNGWYKVDYKSVEGYMSGEYLNVSAKADVTIGYGLVQSQGSPLNVRSGPGTSYGKVTSLNNGAVVNIVGIDNGWYKILPMASPAMSAAITWSPARTPPAPAATAPPLWPPPPAAAWASRWWTTPSSTSVAPMCTAATAPAALTAPGIPAMCTAISATP